MTYYVLRASYYVCASAACDVLVLQYSMEGEAGAIIDSLREQVDGSSSARGLKQTAAR